jgi:molybdopterin-dependent oxidoreductase alpha subunit
MKRMKSGGGWAAIQYTLRMANRVGWRRLWKAMRAKNTCKTCALGMGGQAGGMRNEMGHWPEVCKKSLQAMVADMQQELQPEFFRNYSISQLQTLSPRELEWCGRLTAPLYAGAGDSHYRIIAWHDALGRIAGQLKATSPDSHFFYASGRSSNEAGFLLQLFARLHGTNFVNNCSFYCHQASAVGLAACLGTATATVTLADVEGADLFVLLGGNPASNHPRLMRTLLKLRRRKGHVIVVNPVKEIGLVNFKVPSDPWSLLFGSPIASLYVQPHIGGDIALLTGVAKVILKHAAVDAAFLAKATEGFEAYAESVRSTSWEAIEQGSGVNRATVERMAEMYAAARHVVFGWTMGITQHEHGVANVQTIVNLALLRGMVGRPHTGLLPIRGHSNVQGMGSVGVVPALKPAIFDNLESHLKVKLPRSPGLDTLACMQAAERGDVRSAFCLGGNLFGSNPDSRFAHRALGKLELVTYLNTTLNTGHVWGRGRETLILPVLARDEEAEPTTHESMFNFVRLSDGGQMPLQSVLKKGSDPLTAGYARHQKTGRFLPHPRGLTPFSTRSQGPCSEVEIIASVAQQVLAEDSPVDWQALRRHCHVRELIARIIPGYEKIGAIDRTKEEFSVEGRILHNPRFSTSSGKARFVVHPLPPLRSADNALRLMTVRSEGQFNTVVYEEEDLYRGQERRDVILMSHADIERFGLRVDQRVTVRSSAGAMAGILVREHDIKAGNALMYYPEANVLVPAIADPLSKTPAFKCVVITVEPGATAAHDGSLVAKSDGLGMRVPLNLMQP